MKYYFSFDVESVGLYGPPFAYGWCVVDEVNCEHANGISWYLHPHLEFGLGAENVVRDHPYLTTQQDIKWVSENVLPHLPTHAQLSNEEILLYSFWSSWMGCCKNLSNLTMVTDCPYPVESNFLRQVVLRECMDTGKPLLDISPYPVIDVASVLLAKGWDPLGNYDRLPNEEPAHNPLSDARQSVRIMLEALSERK